MTRHPTVTEMVKKCDQKKVLKGMEQALHSLKNFINTTEIISEIFSIDLSERILSLFEPNSKVRMLLESELEKLNINISLFEHLL